MMDNKEITCHACHKALDLQPGQKISLKEECPYCYASVHCCKMCKFYDITAYNECRESSADRIVEKEKANFCDYFVLKGGGNGGDSQGDLLAAANALFK
ncbi:hypothetical protein ACRXCV_02135 [Halobacteriovorax sp. GFR7]|uniref:hypothetical protein n=1 Tax=unclassified Halobacteriovorax TaxID=2639665 RepID=UPI003D966BD8